MNTLKTYGLGGVALVIAIIALFAHGSTNTVVTKTASPKLGGVTNYDTVSVSQGLITTGVNATSSTASTNQVLSQSDIQGYSVISFTPNVGTLTLVLPATTSLSSSFLPNPGDRTSFIINNATGTAGILISLAPNTGSLIEGTSSTAVSSTTPGKAIRVEVFRKVNTDLIWLLSPFI